MSLVRTARHLTQRLDLLGQKSAAMIEEVRRQEYPPGTNAQR